MVRPRPWVIPLASLLLFAGLFLYLRLRIDMRLLNLRGPGLFIPDLDFLRSHLTFPGDPGRYLAGFLQGLYWFPNTGALVASALVLLVCLGAGATFKRMVPERDDFAATLAWWSVTLLPAALAVVGFGLYWPARLASVLIAILLGLLYTLAWPRWPLLRVVFFAALLFVVLFIDPAMGPLFAALCALWEVAGRGRGITGLVYAACGMLPGYVAGAWAQNLGPEALRTKLAPVFFPQADLPALLILGLLLLCFGALAARRQSWPVLYTGLVLLIAGLQWDLRDFVRGSLCFSIVLGPAVAWAMLRTGPARGWSPRPAVRRAILLGTTAALLLGPVLVLDTQEEAYLRLKLSCRERKWAGALESARLLRRETYEKHPEAYTKLHRALYHAGRLPYDLLQYPVSYGQMMAVPMPRSGKVFAVQSEERAELALDLGMVNHAELMAYDALDAGLTPGRAYELLALIYIAKDNRRTARNFLNVLEKSLIHREWAEHYQALLDSGESVATDARIREIRENMIRTDRPEDAQFLIPRVVEGWIWEPILNRLLEVNPRNRMAFEYLMSLYLLTDRPGMVAKNLARMRRQGYTEMPVLYQEALLTACFLHGYVPGADERSLIDPTLAQAYRSLAGLFEQLSRDPAATLRAMQPKHGSLYFAYSMWCKANAKAQ